jgi:uncharacterized protein (TIGR03118 family)
VTLVSQILLKGLPMKRILSFCALLLISTPSVFGVVVSSYTVTKLVSDQSNTALLTDANLVNPWGLTESASSPFWSANNGTNTSTLYGGDAAGSPWVKNALTVTVAGGAPTGEVFNGATGFLIFNGTTNASARFLWATEDGEISAWTGGLTTSVVAAQHAGSEYKGLAIGNNGVSDFLYAADFANNKIDVYNNTFALTTLAGAFVDPTLPAGYAPFNIQNLGGVLYVAYALVDMTTGDEIAGPGNGYISKFDTNGNFLMRLVSNGPLNAPWGMAIAPASFGTFGSSLLVGNFGDGRINSFNSTTGAFLGTLNDPLGNPISIDGLWAIMFGNGAGGGDTTSLYFTSGPSGETHGLLGKIIPSNGTVIFPTATTIKPIEGAAFSGAVAAFADSNGTGTYSATINWGDSTTTAGTVISTGAGGLLVTGTHTYAEENAVALPVTVTLTDTADVTTATANSTVLVADAPLTGTPVTFAPTTGTPFTGSVATFTDADPAGTASDYTATINWGDASPTSAGVISGTGPFTVTGAHTYFVAGAKTVTVTINDVGGASTVVTSTANVAASASIPLFGAGALLALGAALAGIALLLMRK